MTLRTAACMAAVFLAGTVPAQLCGDCDRSGTINVLDSLRVAQMAVAIITPMPNDFCVCDADGSGVIDVIDALLVAQVAVSLSVTLSCPPCTALPPSCWIGLPRPTSPTQRRDPRIDFYVFDMDSPTLAVTSEFTTDGGVTYLLATPHPTSPPPYTMNPIPDLPVTGSQNFVWDTVTDLGCLTDADFRITVDDGTTQSQCFTTFTLVGCGPPGCIVLAPMFSSPPGRGDVAIDFDTIDPDSPTIQVTVEWSPFAPLSYTLATVSPASPAPYTTNPTGFIPIGASQQFIWDSVADFPTTGFVRVRITVSDGILQNICNTTFELDN